MYACTCVHVLCVYHVYECEKDVRVFVCACASFIDCLRDSISALPFLSLTRLLNEQFMVWRARKEQNFVA